MPIAPAAAAELALATAAQLFAPGAMLSRGVEGLELLIDGEVGPAADRPGTVLRDVDGARPEAPRADEVDRETVQEGVPSLPAGYGTWGAVTPGPERHCGHLVAAAHRAR